ncbi:gluconate 2-dehydrogenase subunit 3 family protein [Pseudemcibacter aquimaris]|uniref:gluconate 2-dehydrogenase subunit 3 family protein n=1 Tax=Pseudemcibacter aquimaris TaxID=2857064 RepID=UPI0020122C41|nr:gluconate 2-dehydrogenase subunit 3 family protein [Pseudemcibacter aquimaris]MCC3860415.1 gluconate 2-dehydrogenase subunit 3 family protein [Pseudemcibacter aquimaris]WDU57741.1 gluconate 2-dehydrogenase subunit 3 family protein [Pseudemcibacter aquimaris]
MHKSYSPKVSRRDSLKWIGKMSTTVLIGGVVVACDTADQPMPEVKGTSHWPNLTFDPIMGPKYGQDPDMTNPTTPWARTLTQDQLNLIAHLSDIICPADEGGPSATVVGVPDVIDEWVSAPYEAQQNDRVLILNGLQWLDDEANMRNGSSFMNSSSDQQIAIIDDIAYEKQAEIAEFEHAVMFFARLRSLVFGAYFSSPEGIEDIGYIGNEPIIGDYPGPTEEAMAHLNEVIANLPA